MEEYTRANGREIRDMATDTNSSQMATHIKDFMQREKLMDRVYLPGKMERSMTENGSLV